MTQPCKYCGQIFEPSRCCAEDEYSEQCSSCVSIQLLESLEWKNFIYELYKEPKNVDRNYLIKRYQFVKRIRKQWEELNRGRDDR